MRFLLAVAILATSLAGCLGDFFESRPDFAGIEAGVHEDAFPLLVQDHDHRNATLHAGASNMDLVGYHNGFDGSGDPNAIPSGVTYNELAVTQSYVYLARGGADGGFVILDKRDPAMPLFVGEFDAQPGADIEVNADESLAFFATQRNTIESVLLGSASDQNVLNNAPRGIAIVDITDKVNPALANFQPLPYNGPHTITYHRHSNGNDYLIACTYDLAGNTVPSSTIPGAANPPGGAILATQRMIVFQIQDGGRLVPVSEYQITQSPPAGKLFMPHDAIVDEHPAAGTLVYVAYWDKGVRVLDFNDPANLVELDGWTEFAPSTRNNIHQARAFADDIDGRRVLVAEPEIIRANETGYMTFLDVTDPSALSKLGYWTLPGELFVEAMEFSPHNFALWDGKVALGHYHAGVWVIDASDGPNLSDPKSVGFYMPAMPRDESPARQPNVWGTQVFDGIIYATDAATGLHILRYNGP